MPKTTKEEREAQAQREWEYGQELVPVQVRRNVAEKLEELAARDKRTLSDFVVILLREIDDGSTSSAVLRLKKHDFPPTLKRIDSRVTGNVDVFLEWLSLQLNRMNRATPAESRIDNNKNE